MLQKQTVSSDMHQKSLQMRNQAIQMEARQSIDPHSGAPIGQLKSQFVGHHSRCLTRWHYIPQLLVPFGASVLSLLLCFSIHLVLQVRL